MKMLRSRPAMLGQALAQIDVVPGATERLSKGRPWMRRRERVLRAEPLCRACAARGIDRLADEVDHIIALADGGQDTDDNLQPLCRECHAAKTAAEAAARVGRQG